VMPNINGGSIGLARIALLAMFIATLTACTSAEPPGGESPETATLRYTLTATITEGGATYSGSVIQEVHAEVRVPPIEFPNQTTFTVRWRGQALRLKLGSNESVFLLMEGNSGTGGGYGRGILTACGIVQDNMVGRTFLDEMNAFKGSCQVNLQHLPFRHTDARRSRSQSC